MNPEWVPRWFTNQIRTIAATNHVQYYHQGHYYPRTAASTPNLDAVTSLDERFRQFPVIVGEFPTRFPARIDDSALVPEWEAGVVDLPHEGDETTYLYHRVRRIESLGYAGAFFWSLNARGDKTSAN